MESNLKEHQEHLKPEKEYISKEYLLGVLDKVHDCRDILLKECICGRSVYCLGCQWWNTLAWVKEVVKNAPGIVTTPPV